MSRRQSPRRVGAAAPPPAPATRSRRDRWRGLLPFALVLAVVLTLHGRSVGFDFTYLDDKTLILDQLAWLTRSTSLKETLGRGYLQSVDRDQAYYRPLVTLSYALDARRSGERPFGYRLTNLLLFACPLLLLALLRRLPLHPGVALAGALVFAVHPALTEAIAWIPGRNDTLLTLFALAAWLLALRAFACPSWWARLGHLLCFGAALLSKEPAVAVPLAVLAHLRLVEQRSWRELRAPWLWIGWALVLTTYTLARFNALSAPLPRGGSGLTAALLLGRGSVIFSSLGKIVLPAQLAVLAIIRDTPVWPGLVATLALALAALLLPGSRRGIAALGGVVALAFVLPGLLVADTLILENRLVMPAVGVVLVACAALDHLARQWPRPATASAGALVALLSLLTWRYSDDFRGRRPFAEAAVRGSPHAPLAWVHLGTTLQREGDAPGAERAYREVLRLDPREPIAHNNLGVLLLGQGRAAEAEAVLRTETVINPRYARAHFNLGLALRQLGHRDEAVACWERALELEPENVDTLGQLLGAYQGRDPARTRAIVERLGALGIQLAAPPAP